MSARAIFAGFESYRTRFLEITRRAPARFLSRDRHGMQTDAAERLDVYGQEVDRVVASVRRDLAGRVEDPAEWARIKAAYLPLIEGRPDREIAETFFNSITRRVFTTVGVDPRTEFVDGGPRPAEVAPSDASVRAFVNGGDLAATVREVFEATPLAGRFEDIGRDATAVARRILDALASAPVPASAPVRRLEMIEPVFYRGQGAYLVGRVATDTTRRPMVLALLHGPGGVFVDAALLDEDSVSIVFSFARNYFHVEVERPRDMAHFLKWIMPRKPWAEIYIALGFHKHGKTELFRDLRGHLAASAARFEHAAGQRGLVMIVFGVPDFDVVFKVIRDDFGAPKRTDRRGVVERYRLVFRHDRVGRLLDAQEFEHLEFARERFAPELLEELTRAASSAVEVRGDSVVLRHLYVERKVTPLDLYVRSSSPAAAHAAVVDWGRAIKNLAAADIFPGDLLPKNFGVTRHGRVVFYDYDELTFLHNCRFRDLPEPADPDEAMAAEPWFGVGEDDVFPEEFGRFLGLPPELRPLFLEHHADLLGVGFWRETQERLARGERIRVAPYGDEQRLDSAR